MHPGITAQSLGNWGATTTQDGWRKGPWTSQEDKLLIHYVNLYGEGRWNNAAKLAPGLKRNGKSCRLRWVNYLRPDLKKGQITQNEEKLIVELHAKWGNRWSQIAKYLKGRTDNEIKNYWRTHFKKRTKSPSHDPEKTNSRMFKRQQFQLQLQKQQPQYRGDVENFTSWFNEGSIANEHHTAQETVFPWVASEQAAWCPYPMISNYSNVLLESNGDILWDDGLWDFDAFFGGKS